MIELSSPCLLGIFASFTILGYVLGNALRFKVDPREPPVVYPKFPLIGHVIGMLTDASYLKKIYDTHGFPIFTLPMWPAGRTYVVASPDMVSAVQKAPSSLGLDAILSGITARVNDSDPETARIIQDTGENSLFQQYHKILSFPALTDGSAIQLSYLAEFVNNAEDGCKVELFNFVSRFISLASNRTFFGPENPYDKHPDLLDRFWEWENGMVKLLMGIVPRITVRKAHKALRACAERFIEYEEAGGYADAHYVVKARNDAHIQLGISRFERAKLNASLGFAFNVNASITAFWMLSNAYSRPDLLAHLRVEIQDNALSQPGTLSFSRLRDSCPGLYSLYRETLRYYASFSAIRWVDADTMLADRYLVRKGTILQMVGAALHQDKATWGPDAEEFNPDRFLHNTNGTKTKADGAFDNKSNVPPAAFRSFGGGRHMCPGRHFAAAEILSLSAAMILSFDMEAVEGTAWNPSPDRKRFPTSVEKPSEKLMVRMHRRQGYKNVQWKLQL
ncbi:hypothetical protein E8E11_011627 [Didymella keratinophila]|nr:hypothetical protein E8E11_011627 [Didymella keratinophila]